MLTKFQLENYDGAGFVFMTEDWKFIMVKDRTLSKWGMCKGHREPEDDHYLDTAKREAFEELGLYDDEYTIVSEPFVLPGSPKIYIFHMAILMKPYELIDITDKDISSIKIVAFDELLEQIDLNDTNIYMRLFHAHIMGTFQPKRKAPTKNPFYASTHRRHVLFGGIKEPLILPELPVESHIRTVSPCMLDTVDAADEEVASLWNELPLPQSPNQCFASVGLVYPTPRSPRPSSTRPPSRCSPHLIRPISRNSLKNA